MKLYDITLLCLSLSNIVFAAITTHEIGPTNFKPGLHARFYEAVIPDESNSWGNEDYFRDQEYIQDGNLLGQIDGIPTATVSYHRHYNDFVHGFYIDPDDDKQIVMELRGYFKLRQTEYGAVKWVAPFINLCGKDAVRDTAAFLRLHPDIGLYNVTSDTMCEFESKEITSLDYIYVGGYADEGTASFQYKYQGDRWYPFMLAIVIGGDALEGEFQIFDEGVFKTLDSDQLMYNPDEDYPYFDDMRRTFDPADGMTALERCPHYDADNSLPPQIAPPYSTIEFSCSTSISSIVSSSETSVVSSDSLIEPTSSDPIVEPTSSDPIVEPTSSDLIVETTSSDPIVEPTSSDPIVEPTSSDLIVETTSSDPIVEPTSSDPIVEPTSSDPIVEPTSSDAIIEPTSSDPIIDPTSSDPTIEITSSDLIVEPTSSDLIVETTSQMETSSTSKDPWYSQEPTDTLPYTTTTDEYVTTPETGTSYDFTESQTSTRSSADIIITSETMHATSTDVEPTISSIMSEETPLSYTSDISTETIIETTPITVIETTSSEFLTDIFSTPQEPDTTVHLPTTTTQFVTVTDATTTVEEGASEGTTNIQNVSTSTIGTGEVPVTEPLSTASDQSEGDNGPETIIPEPMRTTTVLEAVTQGPTGIDKSHEQTTTVLLPGADTNSAKSSVHTTNYGVSDIMTQATSTEREAGTQSTSTMLLYSTVTTAKSDSPQSLEGFEGQASTYHTWTIMWAFMLAIAVL